LALVTAPFRGEGLERLKEVCEVVEDPWIVPGQPLRIWNDQQLAARIDEVGATVLICEADMCVGAVLERPLRVIGSTRGDPTNVDLAGATARGIPVVNAPGRNADGVAEMTVALLFAVTRHIVPADREVRAGEVFKGGMIPYQRYRAWQVAGRTAGLIGFGAVGRATKWRLEGLGMKVIATDPFSPGATHSLDDLLAESDVVSVHAAVTPENFGLLNDSKFERMREGGVYLNTARAALHDLDALTRALESGHLAGAGLDHFEGEQLPEAHPLLSMDNVVLTPHIGGATYDTEANHSAMIAADVAAILAGEVPQHCANPEVLE
jgi:D-3-phosphoglycerate dehydrogenase